MNEHLHQSLHLKVNGIDTKLELSEITCPVCSYNKRSKNIIYDLNIISIVECPQCSTMHLQPMPNENSLSLIYNNNYYSDAEQLHGYFDYSAEEHAIEKTYKKRLKFIADFLSDNITYKTRFHEIGCALGIGLSQINKIFSTSATGSDLSRDAEKACKEKGIPFYLTDSIGRHNLNNSQKDIVFAFDVIEHLTNIPEFILFLEQLIDKNGYLIITTPNMNSFFNRILGKRSPSIKIPQHTIYFTTDTLKKALNKNFKFIKSKNDYQYASLARIIERVLHILGLKFNFFNRFNINLLVPNGMSIYIFKKRTVPYE